MSLKIYLDARRLRKDGSAPLKLTLCLGGKQRHVALGLFAQPRHWDAAKERVANSAPLARSINLALSQRLLAAQEALVGLPARASFEESLAAVKASVCPEREPPKPKLPSLVEAARRFQALHQQKSTRESYECLIRHIGAFCGDVALDGAGREWLMRFDAHMAQSARSANARAVYMRNLRAVFNFAIDEGWTQNYPFRKFKIKTVKTAKRSMPAEDLRRLFTMEVEPWQRPYRDFFMLSFLLMGMNSKDLLLLPAGADASGRIEFNRAKTGKLYSMLLEPEAKAVIDRYRGEAHLLSLMDGRQDSKQFMRQCNHALKLVGCRCGKGIKPEGTALWPFLTTYYARHSWATIAAELDVPKETIAAALGHDMGNSTTAIYIDFNRRKVDEANRRVIDFVLYGKR